MYDDPDDTMAHCRLKDPVNMRSLLTNQTAEFSIRDSDLVSPDGREEDTELNDVYKFEEYEPYIFVESDSGTESENGNEGNPDEDLDVAFPSLRRRMFKLRDDEKVMKKVVRHGSGEHIPEDDGSTWIVYVHYAAHVEFGETPFDCTYLRQRRPIKQRLGPNEGLLPGYEIAIRSMRKGEKSRFLIHPDLAYKSVGSPPRIPPNATLHFEIELFDFVREDEKAVDPYAAQPLPETCQDKIAKARRCRERGNKRKNKEKNVNGAISQYRKGIGLLLQYHMANAEEEEEIRSELIKLYVNLAVSYLSKEDYKRVCITYNDAVHDCGAKVNKNVKLNYVSAKALRFLANFSEAKNRIRKAAKLKPGDEDILHEMNTLAAAIDKAQKEEKNRARKMMGFGAAACQSGDAEEDDIDDLLTSVSDDFKESFLEYLSDFLDNPNETTKRLPFEHTQAELRYCERVCREKNVGIRVGNERIILLKRSF